MDILLPKLINGGDARNISEPRQITIIGANGAGKTRFCHNVINNFDGEILELSALKGIYDNTEGNNSQNTISHIYNSILSKSHFLKADVITEFDKLIFLLLHDEFIEMLKLKASKIREIKTISKLDTVIARWEEVFPKNKIFLHGGNLLVSSENSATPYSSLRLSDGEKAVLYYLGGVMYAAPNSLILVDDPTIFLHHSIAQTLWNVIEQMRSDCTFIYSTHDINFASTRTDNLSIWVKDYSPELEAWDYDIVKAQELISEELLIELLGSRKPILFIEGDEQHSIDAKLYALIFPEYTIKPLGSCNKVIESVRSFNDLRSFHNLESKGIVDRDRREEREIEYLRGKNIYVPNVAEIENILMLEGVIKGVAAYHRRDPENVFAKVKMAIMALFTKDLKQQALLHVRHKVKSNIVYRIDKKFQNINALEEHMLDLVDEINPRGAYEGLCRNFHNYLRTGDYSEVLRVYNQKSMLRDSGVGELCGTKSKEGYIKGVLKILKGDTIHATHIRHAIIECLNIV
ncbi:MAG: DUF4435 domain-containing protein [Bacteroidales bacterium]